MSLETIVIEPPEKADACVIWLHGLGADGHDFVEALPGLNLPPNHKIRFIFPHAPYQPVTLNNGMTMRAWYDVISLDFNDRQDEKGIKASEQALKALITSVQKEIKSERIILMGFSQGGAMVLHTALRLEAPLAGVGALSSYLPLQASLKTHKHEANKNISIFMGHGTKDPLIPILLGQWSAELLTSMGYHVNWHAYPIEHTVSLPELNDVGQWIVSSLQAIKNKYD